MVRGGSSCCLFYFEVNFEVMYYSGTAEGPRGGSALVIARQISQHHFKSQRRRAAIQRREIQFSDVQVDNVQLKVEVHYLREQLSSWERWWVEAGVHHVASPHEGPPADSGEYHIGVHENPSIPNDGVAEGVPEHKHWVPGSAQSFAFDGSVMLDELQNEAAFRIQRYFRARNYRSDDSDHVDYTGGTDDSINERENERRETVVLKDDMNEHYDEETVTEMLENDQKEHEYEQKLYTRRELEEVLAANTNQVVLAMEQKFENRLTSLYEKFDARLERTVKMAVDDTRNKYEQREKMKIFMMIQKLIFLMKSWIFL